MYKKQTKCAKNEQMWCKCVAKLQASECAACRCNVSDVWWVSDVWCEYSKWCKTAWKMRKINAVSRTRKGISQSNF